MEWSYLNLFNNHLARKAQIYMKPSSYSANSSFIKSWSLRFRGARIGKTIFKCIYIENKFHKKLLLQNQLANFNQT
jgi:hypothetical protein